MNLIKRLRRIALWKKFTCLGLLCLAVITVPTLMYWNEVHKTLTFTASEQQALPQARLILNIIQHTQQHRGLSARFLQNHSMANRERRSKAEELEAAISSYEVFLDENPNAKHREAFERTVDLWHNVHRKVSRNEISPHESFEQHTALIYQQLQYLRTIIDAYQLSLDPYADGYFLMEASLMRLPELTETLGQIRGYSVGLLARGNASLEERMQLKALIFMTQHEMNYLDASINKAVAAQKKDGDIIYQKYQNTKIHYQNIVALVQHEILDQEELSFSPETFYVTLTQGIDSYYSYAYFSIDQLENVLSIRISANKNNMFALLSYVLCITLIVAVVCIGFIRRLLHQLGGEPQYATEVVQAITRGDLDYEVETSHPESLLANVKRMQEKLKESDRLKTEFVSTVSHELRTPLTAIGGALSLSVSGQLGVLPEPAFKMLDIAQKNSLRLTELINDLLDIDKLTVGKLELDMLVQPLMPIIDDASLSMASYAQKYGVKIVTGLRFEYILVKVDARRLRQVLVNFLSNASKFSHKGDQITINTSVTFDKVRIEVIDHGCGIAEEFQEKIFQKFSQADSSDTRSAGGTGLGLAISKELIQAMGGDIGFTSTPGIGSCFYVVLPLEEPNSD